MRVNHLGDYDDDALQAFDETMIPEYDVTDDAVYDPAYDVDPTMDDPVVWTEDPNPYVVPVAPGVDPGNVTSATATDGTSQHVSPDGSTVINAPDGSSYMVDEDGTIYSIQADGTVDIVTPDGNVYYSNSTYQDATGNSIPAKTNPNDVYAQINEFTKFALGQIAAWKNVGKPSPVVARPITQASGAVVTPNKNGTVSTKLPNGKTTVARMPVGKPYVFPDGSTVINNGNGTITTIDAQGVATTSGIGATPLASGIGSNIGIMAAFGIGLLLISG